MEKKTVGAWIIITSEGKEYFADRFEGETLESAVAEAEATFGAGCTVKLYF